MAEDSRKDLLRAEYKYKCLQQTTAYPYKSAPNPTCGTEDRWAAEDVGKSLAGLNGAPICLSCEDFPDARNRLNCLKKTVNEVIVPKAVAIRPEQLKAVSESLAKLQKLQTAFPNTLNVDEALQIGELTEKVNKAASELH